ncbi:vesicle-trafficking protein SEC22a-like [Tubulanus polymorphus]|uniref:vesicle-trafficking protein SEC22a-like n=1 Tax=Tubulanus polymorphus TaxID=672921 RepID=UPI003DA1E6F7
MLLCATISRVNDGLPLSATTDNTVNQQSGVVDAQKYVKIISKRAAQLPERSMVKGDAFVICFVTDVNNVCYIVVSELEFSSTIAFAFLDEIQKQFISTYDPIRVKNAQRPYAFIQFDTVLQKTKSRFNNRGMTMKMDRLVAVQHDLASNPPQRITTEELESMYYSSPQSQSNGTSSSSSMVKTWKSRVSPRRMFMPLTLSGFVAGILCLVCGVLNLVRGMSIINDGHIDTGQTDSSHSFHEEKDVYKYGTVFLMACLLCLYQVYLLTHTAHWRKYQAYVVLIFVLLCNFYLSELRNLLQLTFHCAVCGFSTVHIITRQLQGKLPQYNV